MFQYNNFHDYSSIIVQYCFILFFGSVFPLAPLIALLNNVCILRLSAYKICYTRQRPIAQKSGGLGVWEDLLQIMSVVGILTNCGIMGYTSTVLKSHLSPAIGVTGMVVALFALEHLILLLKYWLSNAIPRVPFLVQRAQTRDRRSMGRRKQVRHSVIVKNFNCRFTFNRFAYHNSHRLSSYHHLLSIVLSLNFHLDVYPHSLSILKVRHDEKKKRRTLLSSQINSKNYNHNGDDDYDDNEAALQLRFDGGEGASNTTSDTAKQGDYTSYYDCFHEGEGEDTAGNDPGDVSPLLPFAPYSCDINSDNDDGSGSEGDTTSVQTLRKESDVQSPCLHAFRRSLVTPDIRKETDRGLPPTVCSGVLECDQKTVVHSGFHDETPHTDNLRESRKAAIIVDESVGEKEAVENDQYDQTYQEEVLESNVHELKNGDKDSDSDCDTVPSPTPPPTLSTIPPSSAARKTLSMESRDPRISLTRRNSRAPSIAPTRSPRISIQPSQQFLPRPFRPVIAGPNYDNGSSTCSGSESDDSSSDSYHSSSGEDFNMPSSMSLQDTIIQRSRTLHSRSSSAFQIRKIVRAEEEEEEVEKCVMERTVISLEVSVPRMLCQAYAHFLILLSFISLPY